MMSLLFFLSRSITKENTVAKLGDPEIQLMKNVAYSQVHYPRGSLPTPPFAIHQRTEAVPQEGVYETIPGENQPPPPQDSAYEIMNPREEPLPTGTTDNPPEAEYEMVNLEDIS